METSRDRLPLSSSLPRAVWPNHRSRNKIDKDVRISDTSLAMAVPTLPLFKKTKGFSAGKTWIFTSSTESVEGSSTKYEIKVKCAFCRGEQNDRESHRLYGVLSNDR